MMPRARRCWNETPLTAWTSIACRPLNPLDTHCRALKLWSSNLIADVGVADVDAHRRRIGVHHLAGRDVGSIGVRHGRSALAGRKNTNPAISRPMDQAAPEMSTDDGNSVPMTDHRAMVMKQ